MPGTVDVYVASDYAGLKTPRAEFYYGYERTRCPHGDDADCDYCDEKEWCFTATQEGQEVFRYTRSELDQAIEVRPLAPFPDPDTYLLIGIGKYLQDVRP